jgi:dimethylglycine dehydrogenase
LPGRPRDLLAKLTTADLNMSSSATGREDRRARVRALRINYVGELGWERTCRGVSDRRVGIADFGLYAMNSLRMEKAYPAWGAELTNEITPVEAGLDRFVDLDHDFVGRAAVVMARERGVSSHLVYLEVGATDSDVAGGEPVFAGDRAIGVTTSGGFGHATRKSLAFAYVDTGYESAGTRLEVELIGDRRPAVVLAEPVYDPGNARLRA